MKEPLKDAFLRTLERVRLDHLIPQKISCTGDELVTSAGSMGLLELRNLFVVAFGKAAHVMCRGFLEVVVPKLPASVKPTGVIVGLDDGSGPAGFEVFKGGHPLPNAGSFAAADQVLRQLRSLGSDDLVVFLVSGGGSAILEKPLLDAATLDDWKVLNRVLVGCGAGIVDVNIVRKHLSAVKGGRLALAAAPARQLTLFVSDVPDDMPSAVASGPTFPDESTAEDCYEVVERHGLLAELPGVVREAFVKRTLPETPKAATGIFQGCHWHQLLGNGDAVTCFAEELRSQGWRVEIDLSVDDRGVKEACDHLLERVEALHGSDPTRPTVIVTGGELSSPVTGSGIGGRNQAFVLQCAESIAGERLAILSAGTDGVDGSSDAAGAVADGETLARAEALGLDARDHRLRCDSGSLFAALGDAIVTGPTGNNVRDLRAVMKW